MSEYIEREALRDEIASLTMTITGLRAGKGILNELLKQYRESVLRIVDELPAEDVAPVRHGRWEYNSIPDSVLSKCSLCGILYGSCSFNYCPNCGAMMDLEEEMTIDQD